MGTNKIVIRVPQERERRAASRMTGRYLLTVQEGGHQEATAKLINTGIGVAERPMPGASSVGALPRGMHLMLPRLGIAVIDPLPEQEEKLNQWAEQEEMVVALEPEHIMRAAQADNWRTTYADGATLLMRWRRSFYRSRARWLPLQKTLPPGA